MNRLEVSLPFNSTLSDLLEHLEVDLGPEDLLLAVNGRVVEPNKILQDGDEVNLMPAISGGGRVFPQKMLSASPHRCRTGGAGKIFRRRN